MVRPSITAAKRVERNRRRPRSRTADNSKNPAAIAPIACQAPKFSAIKSPIAKTAIKISQNRRSSDENVNGLGLAGRARCSRIRTTIAAKQTQIPTRKPKPHRWAHDSGTVCGRGSRLTQITRPRRRPPSLWPRPFSRSGRTSSTCRADGPFHPAGQIAGRFPALPIHEDQVSVPLQNLRPSRYSPFFGVTSTPNFSAVKMLISALSMLGLWPPLSPPKLTNCDGTNGCWL